MISTRRDWLRTTSAALAAAATASDAPAADPVSAEEPFGYCLNTK
jgi:hypothetical protein